VAQIVSGLNQAVRQYGRLVSARISVDLTGGGLEEWATWACTASSSPMW
jgi:hypothetical protein